ncbi:hypothetical protein M0R45_023250 [Rubus argutus]|uniref:Cytochrome P450 n=1 Tax=Rubus argutus TaxID=59490 RepID=A0AAW1WQS5_RUBAR
MLPHKANANVKIGGYAIPKGTAVHVNVWAIGRDPKVWQDPYNFRPERKAYVPSGTSRIQLGHTYAQKKKKNLVTLMLGHLLHCFAWLPPEGGVQPKEIDIAERPGLVCHMKTPWKPSLN